VVVPARLDSTETKLLQQLRTHRERDNAEVVTTASQHTGGLFSRLRDAFSR
jgi:molecular chaperone DnaJ